MARGATSCGRWFRIRPSCKDDAFRGRARHSATAAEAGPGERRSRIELSRKPEIFNQSGIRGTRHVQSRGVFSIVVLIRALSGAS